MWKFLEFWNRDVGALWLPFERRRIEEYSHVKPNQRVSLSGYDKQMDDRTFALVPTPFSNQVYHICRNFTERLPDENAPVRIEGHARQIGLRPAKRGSTCFKSNLILHVMNWQTEKPTIRHTDLYEYFGLSKDYSLQDFKREALFSVEDLDPEIGDFLVFAMLGTSSFEQSMGGINLTLYDASKSGMSRSVLQRLRRLIPPDIGKQHVVKTPFGAFGLRYNHGFFVGNADAKLTPEASHLLENRTRSSFKFRQASLSLHSKQKAPGSFGDKPCALSDIPTCIPETTTVHRISFHPDYDSFKFMLIHHMHEPQIPNSHETLTLLRKKMEELVEEYDFNRSELTRYGYLNANLDARPTSIFRQSLAHVRTHEIDKITPPEMRKGLDYFEWNLRYVYEIWEDKFKLRKKPLRLRDKVEYGKIRRIIRRYDQGNGVSEKVIVEEAGMKPKKTMQLIHEMDRLAWIYYSDYRGNYKCWRLTHR